MKSILLMFHLESNAGYAIDSLLHTFVQMAERLVKEKNDIHISFTKLINTSEHKVLTDLKNLIEFDPASDDKSQHAFIEDYIRKHEIDTIFGFDQLVWQPSYRSLRKGGVRRFVSYLGAPMSGLNAGLKLALKKLEVKFTPHTPDHYIFESQAMARTAYQGRGIPEENVSVVYLGVDEDKFIPDITEKNHVHDEFKIPVEQKIIYYSGHMEERKGVDVLIKAAIYLYEVCGRRDFHFLLLGNRDGQEKKFELMLKNSGAASHVTFAGYRNDVENILPCCYMGAIASIGWDSFTISSLEVAACGLPLIVSRLQGLVETVEEGETGFTFEPGDHKALAAYINKLIDDADTRNSMGVNARNRVLTGYTKSMQMHNLVKVMQEIDK